MKILIYSDVHISQDSSVIKTIGKKYSTRLEHIVDSLNWAERLAEELKCEYIFNLGDTFDKPIINAMEATAIQDVIWSSIPHYVLVGNHDSNVASLEYSSVSILKKWGFTIISKPENIELKNISFTFLPYITESDRKPLKDYLKTTQDIVLSHNDISGFNFGGFISKDGFNIEDIKTGCKLFLNGHLHNSSFLANNILNVGNLCGQNFSEDAIRYKHGCWVLDTDTCDLQFYENPYSFNFYKLSWSSHIDTDLKLLKPNSCVLVKCDSKYKNELKEKLDSNKNILISRMLICDSNYSKEENSYVKLEKVDHLKLFCDTARDYLGNTELINNELKEICK